MRENKSTHLSDSNSSGKKKSWLGTDLRNLNGSLHHFDFANLDPTVADININLASYWHDWSDIYHEIGQRLDYLFSLFDFNICLSDNMYTDELGEKFLILNHDCAFSNSKEDSRTGEHWKMTDQRWKVPQWEIDIAEGHYYCYNLQLVNLYNHTSLTFACNICNFGFDKAYTPTPHFQDKYGSYKWDNGHILPNNVAYFGVDSSNTNNYFIPSKYFKKVFNYFIEYYVITFDYSFQYIENSHNDYPEKGYRKWCFFDCDKIIDSPEHVHFSEEDWLTGDGNSGHFDRSKVHNLIWVWRRTYSRGDWDACLEYALFSNLYLNKYGRCAWVIAGGAWKNVDHFPYWDSSIYWQIHLSITNIRIIPVYHNIFDKHRNMIHYAKGFTDYSNFIQLDRQPDYILTSENELYYFYRSSVTFNFYNTDILDQVIMKKVSEGINQTLALNHDYTLTKKAGCYQFLVTFLYNDFYSSCYYGNKGHLAKTITFNIRIIPDYDFSQGLNAVTLDYISSYYNNNYSPITDTRIGDYWVVDIYLDRKTISRFYHWLKHSFTESLLIFDFFKDSFKNVCSFNDFNLEDSIDYFSSANLYSSLDKGMTQYHNSTYFRALLNAIVSYWINHSWHLHFVLKRESNIWTILNHSNDKKHFYDKIVQPNQWK